MANATDAEPFVITRSFNAPRALVWKAFTEKGRLAQWWGPQGAVVTASTLDLSPGGVFHYGMEMNGFAMWGQWVFREIEPPARLVFVSSFSTPEGGIGPCPFPMDFPAEVLSTIEFTEDDGRTTLTMRGVPLNATEAQRQTFQGMKSSMQVGWGGTFDKLEGYLSGAS